jgi:hypothetical protein
MLWATSETAETPIFSEAVAGIGRVGDADVGIVVVEGVVGVEGVIGVPLSAPFPSLFEPTRRIISGVEKSAGPSATYPGAFRLSFLNFFVSIKKKHYII